MKLNNQPMNYEEAIASAQEVTFVKDYSHDYTDEGGCKVSAKKGDKALYIKSTIGERAKACNWKPHHMLQIDGEIAIVYDLDAIS